MAVDLNAFKKATSAGTGTPGSRNGSGLGGGVNSVDLVSFTGITGEGNFLDLPLNDLSAWHPIIGGAQVPTEFIIDFKVSGGSKWDSPQRRGKTPVDTFLTRDLVEIKLVLTVFARFEAEKNTNYAKLLEYSSRFVRAKNNGAIVSIYHPSTEVHGVDKITVRSVDGPEFDKNTLSVVTTISMREWTPAPKTSSEKTPEQNVGAGDIKIDTNVKVVEDLKDAGKPPISVYSGALLDQGWGKF